MTQMQKKMKRYADRKFGRVLSRGEWLALKVMAEFKNSNLRQMTKERMQQVVTRYE